MAVALGVYEPPTLPAAGALLAVMVLAVVPVAAAGDAEIKVNPATISADVAPSARIAVSVDRPAAFSVFLFITNLHSHTSKMISNNSKSLARDCEWLVRRR
jgi:hypothetical protein